MNEQTIDQNTFPRPLDIAAARVPAQAAGASGWVVLTGRVLFGAIFLAGASRHFTHEGITHAADLGMPLAGFFVPLSGIMMILGALSVMLGQWTRLGAWTLVAFLVPVTLVMHGFWLVKDDPVRLHVQQAMFMKNLSMLGAALIISQLGAGPRSLDAWRASRKAARGPG
jgi:putative oxidoreductase